MKKIIITMFLLAAIGTFESQAQYRQQTVHRTDSRVYNDQRGTYRYEVREQRVWVPERRTSGLFGIGSRRIPGHYEVRPVKVKVYLNQKGHPHGMPPGQRKKLYEGKDRYDWNDRRDRDDRYERDNRNDRDRKGKDRGDRRN